MSHSRAVVASRRVIKAAAELLLDLSGAGVLGRSRMAGRDLVLAYHDVVEDHEVRPNASGHLGISRFRAQVSALAALADVVPLEAMESPAPASRRPRVAITFDDGYASAFRLAVPVLVEAGLPATFFVCPSLMGGGPFWWDCEGLDVWGRRPELLERLQGRGEAVWQQLRDDGFSAEWMPPAARPASLEEVCRFAGQPGISIGSHTMRHPNLASITEAEVRAELAESRDWLSARFASYVRWIAYPFGLATDTVRRIAREEGYQGAFVLDGGWIPRGADRFGLPRLNIASGLSTRGFRLRLGGIFAR